MDALVALVVSALMPRLLEALKTRAWFPLMHRSAPLLNRVTPVLVALGTASGITWSFDGGVLTVSGLVPDDILRGVLLWALSAAVQHGVYERTIREPRHG